MTLGAQIHYTLHASHMQTTAAKIFSTLLIYLPVQPQARLLNHPAALLPLRHIQLSVTRVATIQCKK